MRLGMRAVANVAVAAATRALLDQNERESAECFREQWAPLGVNSMQCAASSRWLSTWLRRGQAEKAFLAGLLHDIGKMVALRTAGLMVLAGEMSPRVDTDVLDQMFESVHVELGAELCTSWNLPEGIGYVCERHHAKDPAPVATNDVLHVVRIATSLYEARTNPRYRPQLEEDLFWSAHALGLEAEPLQAIAVQLRELAGTPC